MLRRSMMTAIDTALVTLATIAAFVVRDNFDDTWARLAGFWPYLVVTAIVAPPAVVVFGVHRSVWRYAGASDVLRILGAAVVIALGAVALGFWFNRLEGVARSLPVLQAVFIVTFLVASRMPHRWKRATRDRRTLLSAVDIVSDREAVLIVGLGTLTDLYLRSVAECARDRINIVGVVAYRERHTGRSLHGHEVLGTIDELAEVLRSLEVHGVDVDRIVVTETHANLGPRVQAALSTIETTSDIRIEFIAEQLGFEREPHKATRPAEPATFRLEAAADDRRLFWACKRGIDIVASSLLLLVLSPLIAAVAIVAAWDVGLPILFWQRRPGRHGRAFKLFKIRTMRAAHDARGRRLPDEERLSKIGALLRRTRLDELPQLLHVLVGEMSFVGPRPLLPADQPATYAARLLVRPGVTGWAQVSGGRLVSPADKAALDVWYVANASLALDVLVVWRTIPMVLFGESANAVEVERAWRDLKHRGIYAPKGPPATASQLSGVS